MIFSSIAVALILGDTIPTAVPKMKLCDPTTTTRCASVSAAGGVSVLQLTSPWVVSGAVTVSSGSITANAGTNLNTSLLALDATLTGGTQKAIARGAAKGATAAADATTTAEGVDHQGIDVQIYSGGVAKDPTAIRALTSADVVSTSPPANASSNVTQWNGNTVVTNSGTKSAGTLQVVLATDQPALTNKLLVTPDSVALPANQSVNMAQVAGATTATGNGTAAGSIRVSVASDSTGLIAASESGTWTVQPGNTANSTPWLTTDSATSATGSAPPAKATFIGARESTNLVGVIQCDKSAKADIATATTTSIIAVSGSTTIYVCSYVIEIQGVVTTAGTNILEYGTGAACTSPVVISPTWTGSTTAGNPTMIAQGPGTGYLFKTIASQGLCSLTTSTTPQRVFVTYAQF